MHAYIQRERERERCTHRPKKNKAMISQHPFFSTQMPSENRATMHVYFYFIQTCHVFPIGFSAGNQIHRWKSCAPFHFQFMRWTFIYISFTFSEPYIFGLICFQCMPMCWFKFICIGFSHSLIGMCYIYFVPVLLNLNSKFIFEIF